MLQPHTLTLASVFVDAEFSPDQEALRDTVRRFLADRTPSAWVRTMWSDPRGTTDEVWRGLADLGAVGMLAAEADGGTGGGMVDLGVVLEEMGRAVFPGPFVSHAVGAVSAIALAGSAAERAELLPALCDGTRLGAVVLDGVAADGAAADVFVAFDDAGCRVVDATDATVTTVETIDGSRKRARVDVRRGTGRALTGEADAVAVRGEVLDRLCTALAVDGVGAASAALEIAVAYAKERVQFDKPIGTFQSIQHLCAEMLQQLELGRAGAYYALWACERHRAATMAKAYCSDALWRVGAGAIQVLGGIGFTWEHDAHLFYKRLLSLQQDLGGPGQHLDELARLVL
jgi:alkylation response protein AidB-like acyl-CoA dehydrogenase